MFGLFKKKDPEKEFNFYHERLFDLLIKAQDRFERADNYLCGLGYGSQETRISAAKGASTKAHSTLSEALFVTEEIIRIFKNDTRKIEEMKSTVNEFLSLNGKDMYARPDVIKLYDNSMKQWQKELNNLLKKSGLSGIQPLEKRNKKEEISDEELSILKKDVILSRALLGNPEAWNAILSDKSQGLGMAIGGVIMSCVIIYRWGNEEDKEYLSMKHFLNFVMEQIITKKELPDKLDDDRLWKITQEVVKKCIFYLDNPAMISKKVLQSILIASEGPLIHNDALLAAMISPVSFLTEKAQEITARSS